MRRGHRLQRDADLLSKMWFSSLDSRDGCLGYVVQFCPLAFFHHGMANTDEVVEAVLPHFCPGDRLRHPILLGGQNDDDGFEVYGRRSFRGCVYPWLGKRRKRGKIFENAWKCG